jgi:eukaryotic-like serine/threonine-protein kinase
MAARQPAGDLVVAATSADERPNGAGRPHRNPQALPWGKAAAAGPGPPRAGPSAFSAGSELAPGLQVLARRRWDNDLDAYHCWSRARHCCCLVKALRADRLQSPARRRLVREAQLLLRFDHPHLIRAYELLQPGAGQSPLLLLETLDGPLLSNRLRGGWRLPLADLALLGRQLCSVVQYLHDRHYLHLDIQPRTILTDGDRTQLVDLSSARRPGRIIRGWGTSAQISPEQARGGTVTRAADVWGVGLVLYEAATGYRPFQQPSGSGTTGRVRFLQLTTLAPPVQSLRRLPAVLGTALDSCLELRPADRPTVAELDAALAKVE